MQNPYDMKDAYYQKLCVMADADTNAIDSIREELLKDGSAIYCDKEGMHTLSLDQIKEDFGQEIEEGESIIDIINNVLNEIVESIRG